MVYSNRLFFDGSHYITNGWKPAIKKKHRPKSEMDIYFDEIYKIASIKFSVTPTLIFDYIKGCIVDKFGDKPWLDDYINRRIAGKEKALYQRRLRFWRKAQLNKFNYFKTQSFDDEKYDDEEKFRDDYKKTMQNMHTRRGWHYIIKWERGGENNRLHAHSLVYIPSKSQMPGICQLKRSYSTKKKKLVTINQNSFFVDKFGRNDFEPINAEANGISAIQYVGKYLEKDDDCITYSRGLATYLDTDITNNDIAAEMVCVKKAKNETVDSFSRYITYNIISYSKLCKWYRKDEVPILSSAG